MIELIDTPMEPAEYFRRLVECDIVLIAYSRESYRARSSGVLIEALSAGKPVITTAGTWMASQVTDENAQIIESLDELPSALLDLVARLPLARKEAETIAPTWLSSSSPGRFVEYMLSFAGPTPTLPHAPCIVFVANVDAMVSRRGDHLIAHRQLQYLFCRGYRVVGLFITNQALNNSLGHAHWSQQIDREFINYPFAAFHILCPNQTDIGQHAPLDQFRRAMKCSPCAGGETRFASPLTIPATLLYELKRAGPNVIFT